MAKLKFKLNDENVNEGVVSNTLKSIAKVAGITLLSPLIGKNSEQLYNKLVSDISKKNLYKLENDVKKETENNINGIISLVSSVKLLGDVGFNKEPLSSEEVDLVSEVIRDFYSEQEKKYKVEAKRAIDHKTKPPMDYFNRTQVENNFKRELTKKVNTAYKQDKGTYGKLNKWIKEGTPMFSTNLPRQIYTGISHLVPRWAAIEQANATLNK